MTKIKSKIRSIVQIITGFIAVSLVFGVFLTALHLSSQLKVVSKYVRNILIISEIRADVPSSTSSSTSSGDGSSGSTSSSSSGGSGSGNGDSTNGAGSGVD